MQKLLIFLVLTAVVLAQTDADHAESLLLSLHRDAVQNLNEFRDSWKQNSRLLTENVNSWQVTFNKKTAECQYKDGVVNELAEKQKQNQDFLDWIKETTRKTVEKHEKLYQDRCKANRNYIQGLKNDKIMIRLIEFLRKSLKEKESMSLIEKRDFATKFAKFLALYRTNNTKELLQMHASISQNQSNEPKPGQDHVNDSQYEVTNDQSVDSRTESEIGTKHVDDNREQITVDNYESGQRRPFAEYKAELLELLDEMEQQIRGKMENNQEDEVAAGIAAAEFRIQLEKEMQELDRELYKQVKLTSLLAKQMKVAQGEQQQCQQELESVTTAFNEAQDTYQEALDKFSDKEKDMKEEVEVFEYVLKQYQSNVSGKEYREQLDDYTADGSYDNSYNDREVDQIDFMNP